MECYKVRLACRILETQKILAKISLSRSRSFPYVFLSTTSTKVGLSFLWIGGNEVSGVGINKFKLMLPELGKLRR